MGQAHMKKRLGWNCQRKGECYESQGKRKFDEEGWLTIPSASESIQVGWQLKSTTEFAKYEVFGDYGKCRQGGMVEAEAAAVGCQMNGV